jgi:predicted nucleotide-binding protein
MQKDRIRPKVLIVDDQENWQAALTRICSDQELTVTLACSLDGARVELDSSRFAVIILDMIPPDDSTITGVEQSPSEIDIFLTLIGNRYKHTPVLLLSGSITVYERHRVLEKKGIVTKALRKNVSMQEIADCINELLGIPTLPYRDAEPSGDVFVVYGHDLLARESVLRVIEKLELHAIILPEQIIDGKTIIESIEHHSNAGFVVVLLTPDDRGYQKDRPRLVKLRARQNVIFELGFCMGKLGRNKVCALYKDGVELPSDFQGLRYISMDDGGAWRFTLGKEIQETFSKVGIDVDLNKLV